PAPVVGSFGLYSSNFVCCLPPGNFCEDDRPIAADFREYVFALRSYSERPAGRRGPDVGPPLRGRSAVAAVQAAAGEQGAAAVAVAAQLARLRLWPPRSAMPAPIRSARAPETLASCRPAAPLVSELVQGRSRPSGPREVLESHDRHRSSCPPDSKAARSASG